MSFPAEALSCETIEGNPDFYGLGIRIGVYLQWITAWISLLVDPLSAQSVYDVNSVFVFAILVATMIATLADNPTIQPIETYIMLQFALGFFVTTLSTFGLRLHFLRPASVAQLGQHLKGFEGAVRESIRNSRSLSLWFGLFGGRVILPLNFFSPLKPYHLSWSGVFWRTATACMLTALNIWLWFASQPNFQLPGQNCDPPFIFFFSRQQLSGPMVGFCKAVSILIAIVVFPPFLILLQLTMRIFQQTLMALYRDMFQSFAPQVSQRLRQPLTRIDSSFSNLDPVTLSGLRSYVDILDFLSKPSEETYRFSDVLKLIVYLGRGKVEEQREHDAQADNRIILTWNSADYLSRWLCLVWNIFVILGILWFILSIEFTLSWNNIRGVYSIDSAGQLIPFVIGGISTAQLIKKVVLLGLAKKYEDWADVTADISIDLAGNRGVFRIRNAMNTFESENQDT